MSGAPVTLIGPIDHVAITVGDIARSTTFYTDLLNAEVTATFERGGRPSIRTLRMGRAGLSLHQHDNDVRLVAAKPTVGSSDLCLRWLGSAEGAVEHLKRAGVAIVEGPCLRTDTSGAPGASVYFRDPDGNLIELMAPPTGETVRG